MSIGYSPVRLWSVAVILAVAGGGLAGRLPMAYVGGIFVVALVVAAFFWRSGDPMIPFLLLVAAIQGGVLLRLPLGDAPVTTLMPLLGGWTLAAALVWREPTSLSRQVDGRGRLLARSLIALAIVVALTAIAQNWRPDGRLLQVSGTLTLLQLGVLVGLAAYLLSSPRKTMMLVHVTIACSVIVALVAVVDQTGLITLGTELTNSREYTRVSGLVGDPNFFSFQLLVALAFVVHVALAAKSTLGRILTWLGFGVIVAGIISSYSAGALVGVAVIMGTAIVLQYKVSARRALAAFVVIAAATTAVAVAAPSEYKEAVVEKYSTITNTPFEQLGTKRGAAWEAGMREVAANPVLGVGLSTENQTVAIADYYALDGTDRRAAHNMYIGMAVGTGVLGLAAFLVVLASSFAVLWAGHSNARRAGDSGGALASACIFTGLVVVATQGMQLDLQLEKYLWVLVGASLAVGKWRLGGEGVTE
ncbi:MAG: hypothetical protein A2W26_13685 [Acidobacteria bacterium RBG_16_64_8]|nr:MAG: hypothetical protein A2W26_13685 [Acidobacteria bacterium RBG_16_64_8]